MNSTQEYCYNNVTIDFLKIHYETEFCINRTSEISAKAPCTNCSEEYNNLTKLYNGIRLEKKDKFCFALKDMVRLYIYFFFAINNHEIANRLYFRFQMNKTQIRWSKDFKCCDDRKSSMTDFLVASISSICVSIGFYIVLFLFGLRKERIQHIPDDLMPPQSNDRNQSNQTIMNINVCDPITSEPLHANENQNFINDLDGLSTDDEILPPQNPNLIQI